MGSAGSRALTGEAAVVRVIGAGFGRTGSMSLKLALEQLGFAPCLHMIDLLQEPQRLDRWFDAVNGERVDWRELLAEWDATVDWPGCTFYKELMEVFPDAKVLLTLRDPDKWYESAARTIHQAGNAENQPEGDLSDIPAQVRAFVDRLIWGPSGTFKGRFPEREFAIEVFNRHNAEVREFVPAERLLVHEVKDGWEPLATFLGVSIPSKPFPHLNDTAAFREMVGLPALTTK